jgi:hypothetical protein
LVGVEGWGRVRKRKEKGDAERAGDRLLASAVATEKKLTQVWKGSLAHVHVVEPAALVESVTHCWQF